MKKFDKVFKHYDKFIKLFNFNKSDEVKEVLALEGDEILLDIGGGTGKLAEYLRDDCKLIYVLDESQGMLSKVKADEKIVAVIGNALRTDFEDNSIDRIILVDVLHHIKEQEELLKEIYRLLRDKGSVVVLDLEKRSLSIKLLWAFESLLFGKLYFKTGEETLEFIGSKFKIREYIHKKSYFIIKGEKNA